MENDEDAWSYSFPPSSELLHENHASQTTLDQVSSSLRHNTVLMPADSEDSDSSISDSELVSLPPALAAPGAAIVSQIETHSLAPSATLLEKNGLTALLGTSSGLLQPVLMQKSAIADPQTTKPEVSSIMLKESVTNALAAGTALDDSRAMSPPLTPSNKSEFRDSVRIWQLQTAEPETKADESTPVADDALFLRKTFGTLAASPLFTTASGEIREESVASPKIITYRKTNHQRTESESYDLQLRQERFDPKLYVEEKFGGTCYRYATMKRNVDFHQLFRSIDLTDRLLDDFACALSREILLQGRLYITEHSLCFNLNLLGWVTSLVVPFTEIVRIDKKLTAGLFPNGIAVETRDSKHNFASFLLRDSTYDFIRAIWLEATGKKLEELDRMAPEPTVESPLQNERNISNYILLIDGDDVNSDSGSVDLDEDDTSESYSDTDSESKGDGDNGETAKEAEARASTDSSAAPKVRTGLLLAVGSHLRQLKPELPYKNLGPEVHAPTTVSQEFSDSENETEICKEVFDAPMGIVFDVMFGTNTEFQRRFLADHDASEIDAYDAFHPVEDAPTQLERTYTYRRALGYLIGPKSTKCEVREVIEHLNYADYIVVLNTTATPDVPSGGSFLVRTRYYFTWDSANSTQVRVAYYVKWSGRSWIKNVVEKLTLAAQTAVMADMVKEVRAEIEKHTTLVRGPADVTQAPVVEKAKKKRRKTKKAAPEPARWPASSGFGASGVVLALVLLLVLVMQLRLAQQLAATQDLVARQALLTTRLLEAVGANVDLGGKSSKQERASYWAQQAMHLLENGGRE